jgi:uncharacterized tellurite resistance protein B-like protein
MSFKPSENEEHYFAKENAEARGALREKLEKSAQALSDRQKMGKALGSSDEELLEALGELGFSGETAVIFDLLPLVHVSWADGKVQRGERAAIFSILEERKIGEEHPAFVMMESLLEEQPSEAFIDTTLALLQRLGASGKSTDVVDMCVRVAEASGGLLGIGSRISDAECSLIAQVAEMLGSEAKAAFRARLGDG